MVVGGRRDAEREASLALTSHQAVTVAAAAAEALADN